ncbi:MAG: ABC transporter permease [Prevotellaceae bacterium]|nr:ABC transporter permease [Prevotellaceae bacterium]
MKTFLSFILKETRHILRDRRTVMILFGMPIVMMLMFGFAISNDIKNVKVVLVGSSSDLRTQAAVERLNSSEYFTVTHVAGSPTEAERLIRKRKADMAIVFSQNYANHSLDGTAGIQIITDAAEPNMAQQQSSYLQQVLSVGADASAQPVNLSLLYNPQMKSAYNFVPGIMGLLLMIICAMMTAVSIVREKERGTMEVLLVSPARPLMIIVAKAVPYFVLSMVILVCILLLSAFVLDVPVAGSLFWIFTVSLLYILMALSLGLLISVVAETQLVAILMSAMVLLLPSIMLSGMIYPIESMPKVLQAICQVIPARWYISAMRKLMIMGVGVRTIAREIAILAAITSLLLGVALKAFKNRLQ